MKKRNNAFVHSIYSIYIQITVKGNIGSLAAFLFSNFHDCMWGLLPILE